DCTSGLCNRSGLSFQKKFISQSKYAFIFSGNLVGGCNVYSPCGNNSGFRNPATICSVFRLEETPNRLQRHSGSGFHRSTFHFYPGYLFDKGLRRNSSYSGSVSGNDSSCAFGISHFFGAELAASASFYLGGSVLYAIYCLMVVAWSKELSK